MSGRIPTAAREAVQKRSQGRCEACGGRGAHIHHRKRRREGGHAWENLTLLCSTCHVDAHAHPNEAIKNGLIVSAWIPNEEIHRQPLRTAWGWRRLTPQGGYEWIGEEDAD